MKLNEVYKNSGLGKWFHGESANKTPGWDRYDSTGKRVGECGDAKKGEAYAACLSKQKAQKLGKKGIANFVKRKRAAQTEAGRGAKGSGSGKGKKPIFVKTGASDKRKVNEDMDPINEGCGCEENNKKTLFSKIKEKMEKKILKEEAALGKPFRTPGGPKKFAVRVKNEKGNVVTVRFGDPNMEIKRDDPGRRKNFRARHNCDNPGPRTKARYWSCRMWERGKSVSQLTKECADFTEMDLQQFKNKKVLLETLNDSYFGVLSTLKENYVILDENKNVIKSIDPTEIIKVICEDQKILILEKNIPNDSEAWSQCKSQAKKKFDVYPSAYANAWAAKCYKKKGGTWRKGKDLKEETTTKIESDLLLVEKLKDRFFGKITEDIVNADNKGKLTPQKSNPRAKSRDKIREKVKDRAKVVTGPKDKNGKKIRDDTPEEAGYRLATYIELKGKGNSRNRKKKS